MQVKRNVNKYYTNFYLLIFVNNLRFNIIFLDAFLGAFFKIYQTQAAYL